MRGNVQACATVRCAVVGHVEWVEFAVVERVPTRGEIAHALATFEDAAGGGPVAAVQLAKLAGACDFFTALGDDELGRKAVAALEARGLTMHVQWKEKPTRLATMTKLPPSAGCIFLVPNAMKRAASTISFVDARAARAIPAPLDFISRSKMT